MSLVAVSTAKAKLLWARPWASRARARAAPRNVQRSLEHMPKKIQRHYTCVHTTRESKPCGNFAAARCEVPTPRMRAEVGARGESRGTLQQLPLPNSPAAARRTTAPRTPHQTPLMRGTKAPPSCSCGPHSLCRSVLSQVLAQCGWRKLLALVLAVAVAHTRFGSRHTLHLQSRQRLLVLFAVLGGCDPMRCSAATRRQQQQLLVLLLQQLLLEVSLY